MLFLSIFSNCDTPVFMRKAAISLGKPFSKKRVGASLFIIKKSSLKYTNYVSMSIGYDNPDTGDTNYWGEVVIGLFGEVVPKTVENRTCHDLTLGHFDLTIEKL